MTLKEARAWVKRIKASVGDYEGAHGMEDTFLEEVLEAIARDNCEGCTPKELAKAALRTKKLKFPHYCA